MKVLYDRKALNWVKEAKRKTDNGRMWYICPNPIPTTKAYGMAITEMCYSFAKNVNLTLILPNTKYVYDTAEYYGVHNNFHITAIPTFIKSKNQILHFIKEAIFGVQALIISKFNLVDSIYTRTEVIAFIFSPFYKTIYEGHQLEKKMARINKFLLKKCYRIVVLNKYLKRDYSKIYPKNKILIQHTAGRIDRANYSLTKESLNKCENIFKEIHALRK